jgi:hypothetical protein
MWAVAIIAKGAIVKISKSLLLFEDTKKINTPMKKEATIFLNAECSTKGLFDNVQNIEMTKNKATVA